MQVLTMTWQDISRVADLRLGLLDDLRAPSPGQDSRPLRRFVCAFLERRLGLGRHWGLVGITGSGIYQAAGFEARSVEETQLVLSG